MRRLVLLVVLTIASAAAVLAATWLQIRSVAPSREVPVGQVRRTRFVHRVGAEGYLVEVESAPIVVPGEGQDSFKIAWLTADGSRVRAGDPLVRFDPSDVERELLEGHTEMEVVESRIRKGGIESGATLRALDRKVQESELELGAARQFQYRDPSIFSRAQILEEEIDTTLAERRREHSVGVRRDREVVSRVQRDLLGLEKAKVGRGIAGAERMRGALELTAPHDGIVLFAADSNGRTPRVGDPAWSGEVIARIPSLDAVEAEVYVLEADAGGLAVGSSGTVVVEASPDIVYAARVKRVDSVPKPRSAAVPVQYFEVTLELDRFDARYMKPGQRVQATIVLEDLADVLLVPRQAVFDRGGRFLVYRRTKQAFDPVVVKVGSTSPSKVVVDEGLAEGDLVALRDPTRSLEEILPAVPAAMPLREAVP